MVNLNYQSAGITTIETPSAIRQIQGVATNISGMVVLAERGPIGRRVLVTSLTDYIRIFGGDYSHGVGYWAVKGYFENAGNDTPLYIVRTAHYTDITDATTLTATLSSLTLVDSKASSPDDTLLVEAANEGRWANKLQISTVHASKFSTTLDNGTALVTGATSATLTSAAGVDLGTVLNISDGTDSIALVVEDVQDRTIYFDALPTLTGPIADGAAVTEVSFHIIVSEAGQEIERHEFLSMEDTNRIDYVETRINTLSDSNLSSIRVTDLDSGSDVLVHRPAQIANVFLSGGGDGIASLASGDFIGNPASSTGMFAFDNQTVLNQLAIPESQAMVVQRALIDYCELRKYTFAVLNSPKGLTPTDVIEYVEDTAAFNSSRGAFYYPQLKVYDANNDRNIVVPADGHIMGKYAQIDGSQGVQQVAAGELGLLAGVVGFENNETEKKAVRDVLYPSRINPMGNINGFGLTLFGSRTLDLTGGIGSQINERRVFNFLEQSLNDGMGFVLFKNNTAEFRDNVRMTIEAFMAAQLQAGMIDSFFVNVDDALNNALIRSQNKLVAAVAAKVPDTIEHFFILVSKDTRAQEAALQEIIGAG